MVGSVNANESSNKTYEAFKAKALGSASPTSSASGGRAGTPTGTSTDSTTPTQSKGAAPARFGLHSGGGVGVALVGVALGLAL